MDGAYSDGDVSGIGGASSGGRVTAKLTLEGNRARKRLVIKVVVKL